MAAMPDQRDFDAPVHRAHTLILLAAVVLLAVVCFFPLLRYFFSQDDFQLMYRAVYEPGDMLSASFGARPHHFRPLTKIFYFNGAYRVFGLSPLPWHIVSLLIHIGNTLLVFGLLRRLRLAATPAAVAAGFFALNVAFLHVVGWITCIQQLAAVLFMLSSIYIAVGALNRAKDASDRNAHPNRRSDDIANMTAPGRQAGVRGRIVASLVCYLLALMSLEQTFMTPVLIVLLAAFGLTGHRYRIGSTVRTLWPHLVVFVVYSAARLWWKGVPSDGISEFAYGDNIIFNLTAYLSAAYNFWPDVSDLIPYRPKTVAPSHFLLLALIVYNVGRVRAREVIFASAFIVLTLLPALPLQAHYFFYHTYVPAFGAVYLLALALGDAFGALGRSRTLGGRLSLATALAVLLLFGALSAWKVRDNATRAADPATRDNASFVLRRALIAQNVYDSLDMRDLDMTGVENIEMLYGWPGRKLFGGTTNDMYWGLAQGFAIRLYFAAAGTPVEEVTMPTTWDPDSHEVEPGTLVLFYDPAGNCYRYEEVMRSRR
jgi:hypothetical protein